MLIRALGGFLESNDIIAIEIDLRNGFGLFVLHLPNTAIVVIAVWAYGRVGRPVHRAASVVVNNGLITEIDDIHGPIGPNHHFNGPEPQIRAGNEFRLFPIHLFGGGKGNAIPLHEEVADYVQGRLGSEIAVIPLFWPSPAFVDDGTGTGCVAANLVNLYIGLLLPLHGGIGTLAR